MSDSEFTGYWAGSRGRLRGMRRVPRYAWRRNWVDPSSLRSAGLAYAHDVVDIRGFDGDQLLESDDLGDNMIAVFMAVRDHEEVIRRTFGRGSWGWRRLRGNGVGPVTGLRQMEEIVE